MSSPHHHRRLPETLEKAKSGCTKVHTTPAAKKHRENTTSSQLGHYSSEHLIAVVVFLCQHVCLAEGKHNKNILECRLVRSPLKFVC